MRIPARAHDRITDRYVGAAAESDEIQSPTRQLRKNHIAQKPSPAPCRSGASRDRDLAHTTQASFAVAARAATTVGSGYHRFARIAGCLDRETTHRANLPTPAAHDMARRKTPAATASPATRPMTHAGATGLAYPARNPARHRPENGYAPVAPYAARLFA
jgi:hypothetical protein